MKRIFKPLKGFFVCALTAFSFFSVFSSCEVGLGGAVDVQPPSITIQYPKVDSVIRDVFAIGGTWSDDGTIMSLVVTLNRTDGKGTAKEIHGECTFDESVEGGGTWKAIIDYSELELIDGTYQAIVSIKDKSKHETIASTTFTIDNTAPIVVLSRPSTKAGAISFDSYGQTFTLEGKAADDNDVELIEVKIFDSEDSTTPIKTVNLTGIPLTIEQDVAVYKAGEANDYAQIYGHTDEQGAIIPEQILEPSYRYCTFTIYDGAQRYPVDGSEQTEEDKKGNCTNSYYMNSEMDLILASYKINELYHIQNGTFEMQSTRAIALDNVIPQLAQKAVAKSKFSLFPANNPKFIVTSRSPLTTGKDLTDPIYQLTAGNSCLEVEISPGLDKYSIDPDSVGVYLRKTDINGNIIEQDSSGNPVEPICLIGTGAENHTSDKVTIVQAGDTYKFKTVDTISKNNFPALNLLDCYIVEVVGHDSQGADKGNIISDGTFGFQLTSSDQRVELAGKASPSYVSTNAEAWEVDGHEKLSVTLSWSSGDNEFDIYRGETKVGTAENATYSSVTQRWSFVDEIDYAEYSGMNLPTNIDYTLKKNGGIVSTTANISIQQDSEIPSVSNITFKNAYTKEEKIQVNGQPQTKTTYFVRNQSDNKCDIGGIATDDTGIEKVEVIVPDLIIAPVLNTGRFTFPNIDFSSITAATVKATIIATDVAGNQNKTENKVELDIVFDTTAPVSDNQQIDDAYKNLVFRIGDAKNDAGDADVGGKYSTETYGNALSIQVRGNFPDSGSGINKFYYWISEKEVKIEDKDDTDSVVYFDNDDALIDYVVDHGSGTFAPLDETETRWVEYNITRVAGKTYPDDYYDEDDDEEDKEAKLGGIAFGDGGTKPDYVQFKKEITTNFKTTLKGFKEGKNYLVIVAEDNVGNRGLDTATLSGVEYPCYTLNVDIKAPTIPKKEKDNIYVNVSASDTDASKKVYITGTASDNSTVSNASSGIKKIVFTSDAESARDESVTLEDLTTEGLTDAEKNADPTLRTWKVDIKSLLPSSGTAIISAMVTDVAGFETSIPAATIIVDSEGPEVTISSPASSSVNKKVVITGSSNDGSGAGIDTTKVPEIFWTTKESVGKNKPASKITPSANAKAKDGWVKYTATPAQNGSSWSFTVDTTTLKDGRTDQSGQEIVIPDTTPVYFTVSSMDQGGKKVTIETTDEDDNVTITSGEGTPGYSTPLKLIVDQDTDRPIIKMNQVNSTGTGYITSKTVFGSVTDDDGVINKLWVWSTKLNSGAEPSSAPGTTDNGETWTVPGGWIEFGSGNSTLENNNWQIDSTEPDGQTTWFWAVADAQNTVFWTKGESSLEQPYITYSDVAKQENNTGIQFEYDTESPEINSVELLRLATNTYKAGTTRYAASEIAAYVSENNLEWSSANNLVFGKNYALMYAKVEVTEKTGMDTTTPLALDYISFAATDIHVTGPDSNKKYTYYLGPFDLSSNDTDSPTLTFTAKDGAGKTGAKEKTIVVDNIAEITISDVSPAADEIASGKFTLRGQVSDAQSSVTKVEYYIPIDTEKTALDDAATETAKKTLLDGKTFTNISTATSIQFSIDFNNFNQDVLGYKTEGTEVKVNSGFESYGNAENIYQIPVWFKVTDSVGNIGYVTDIQIIYDPNEDRPKVYITDPEISATPVEKGGRIKISGNAQDNEGIAAVYLQFNVDNAGWTDLSSGAVLIPGTTANPLYGFLANNTKNWNYTYNATGITDTKIVQVRAIAVDNDTGLLSAWSDTLEIKVNNSMPFLDGDIYLRQYEDGAVKVEKIYYPGIYVKGDWILEGKISTPNSAYLKSMTITVNDDQEATWTRGTQAHSGTLTDSDNIGVTVAFAGTDDKSLKFTIPVSGSAEWTAEIVTTDASDHSGNEKPSINIDSTPPSFADYSDQQTKKIYLYQDSYGAGGTLLGSSNYVQNSNGAQFTLAGKIVEEQSGFDKAVFYFKRTGSDGVKRVYNPMEGHGTDNQANRTNIASSNSKENAIAGNGGTIYIHEDDQLPVRPLTVTRSSTETATHTEIKTNMNIRVGGLVYIGGIYRLITEVNRENGIVKFEPEAARTYTDAEFVYGLVVDHNGERDNGSGGVDFDDGDGLLESYSGSTTANYRWEATFNSANIPDGPIDIYVVTFDKAGNIGFGYVTTKASNNAPRITKVMLGTDLNGNNIFDFGTDEFTTFYAFTDKNGEANTTKGNAAWTLDTSAKQDSGKYWTAKNGIAVIPEFVGGAGPFYYVFTKGVPEAGKELKTKLVTTPSEFTYNSQNAASNPVLLASGENDKIKYNGANATWTYGSSTSGSNTGGSLTLTNTILGTGTGEYSKSNDTEANPAVVYSFTFWDSTEESVPGKTTGSTILNAYIKQDLSDDVKPNTVIKPFEWTGTGYTKNVSTVVNGGQPTVVADNIDSLGANDKLGITKVINGTTVTTTTITPKNNLYGASKENGHIELEADLPDALKTSKTGNPATELGGDPKVSGKITIHGTSYDNTRLSSIWFKFDGFTTGIESEAEGTTGYTQAATYNTTSATWVPATATMADNNWEFTVSDTYFNQTGHKVDWYLSIDTSQISGVAGLNKVLEVITLDSSGRVSATTTSSSTDDAVNNVPAYQMDVVPYIKGLGTRLDDAYSAVTSVFNRSANGNYPVMRGETGVKLYGFNLNGANTTVKFNGNSVGTVTAGTTSDYVTFTVPTTAKSGEIDVTVNDISALNNKNKVDAQYNLEPNGINNNTLNDNRSVYVWGMNNVLTGVSTVRYPTFRIGKDSKQTIAFVYDRDGQTVWYHKDNGTPANKQLDQSYSQWFATACAVDSAGHIYGSAQNGDSGGPYSNLSSSTDYANYKFYAFADTKNGTQYSSNYGAYCQGGNSVALESCIGNGNVFYAERIQNPKIATLGSDTTKMYTVYYDISYPRIVFRYGEATSAITFTNTYGIKGRTNNSAGNAQVIDNTADVGQYAAVGVVPNVTIGNQTRNVAVVCWNSGNSLKYKYNTNPTGTTWSDTIVLDSDYAGEYCDLAVDAAGGIHIAYYRAGNKLKYAYLSSYNDTTPDICMVDSYLSVGENISIETSSKTISYTEGGTAKTRYVPYISYYSSAIGMAKVAWPVKLGTNGTAQNTFVNGVENDMFTGDWEVQVLPTALTTKLLNYTIGVGEKSNGTVNSVMLGYGVKTGLQTALLY